MAQRRRRVLIVGGGIAGLTAAYELTRTPEARARWDVEIVEMGHRFGGRLASAHRSDRWGRNEEHGLHVWFGFYDNTFRMAEQVYRAWRRPEGHPYENIWDALRPIHHSDHAFPQDDGYEFLRSHHPRNCDRPGKQNARSTLGRVTTLLDAARSVPRTARAWLRGASELPVRRSRVGASIFPPPGREATVRRVAAHVDRIVARLERMAKDGSPADRVARGADVERALGRVHRPLADAATACLGRGPLHRELGFALDVILAVTRAMLAPEHGILEDGDLDRVSRFELRELLARHGAHEETLRASRLLASLYDMPFAYEGGHRDRPVLEASTALRFAIRIVGGYKHAIAYLLRAGAGETLIAPLYEVLAARGVRFRPFHRLEGVAVDRRSQLSGMTFVRCARTKGTYQPLVTRDGLSGLRAEPDFDQLVDGDALRRRGVDFHSRFGDRGETARVTLSVGVDFDDVILALPLGCVAADGDGHSPVAAWLDHHPPARRCLERLHLVPTVAAQLWLDGAPRSHGLEDRAVVTWDAPYSVFCDMSPVIAREGWGARGPQTSLYLCGAHPLESHRARSSDLEARRRDSATARGELERLVGSAHARRAFGGVASLHVPDGERDPYAAQYARANVEPWDLADLPLPGADAVRLEASDTGLRNMSLAGAWVRTHVNTTSIEAAVSSGLAAARALGAHVQPILGESFLRRPPAQPYLPGREPSAVSSAVRSPSAWLDPLRDATGADGSG